MNKTILIIALLLVLFNSCDKDGDWIILCGELNDNLALKEINGNYYYDNIEYFFVNKKSKKCYRNIDTNNFRYAKDLIDSKISQLNKNKVDEKVFKPAIVRKLTSDYLNIEFIDDTGRQILYKINLLDIENDNVFVYTKYKDNYLETIWTDRKSKTRKTKKLTEMEAD